MCLCVGFWESIQQRDREFINFMECWVWVGHSWGLSLHEDEITAVLLALGQQKNPQSNPSTLTLVGGVRHLFFSCCWGNASNNSSFTTAPWHFASCRRALWSKPTRTFMYWSFSFSSSICLLFIAMFSRILLLSCVGGIERFRWGEGGRTHIFTWCAFHNAEFIPPVVFWLRWRCKSRPTAEQQT